MRRVVEKKSFSWRYPQAILGLWLMAGVVTGCATERSMYRGVGEDRSRAYEVWQEACAQEEVTRPCVEGELSMADALKLALSYNKSLQAITREQEIARGVVMESYGNILPSVAGRAEYLRLDQASEVDIGGLMVDVGDEDNYSARLQVTQPLFRGGQISASLRAARWRSLLADDLVREAVQETIYETARAYYDTLLARHLYEVNRAAVESARAYLEDVQVKHEQGIASKFDILRDPAAEPDQYFSNPTSARPGRFLGQQCYSLRPPGIHSLKAGPGGSGASGLSKPPRYLPSRIKRQVAGGGAANRP